MFKGGTCLYKFYKLDRFSEDIDFTTAKPVEIDKLTEGVISDLNSFGIKSGVHRKKEPFNSVLLTLRCEGPLYRGTPQTYASVRIDINLKSSIDAEPENRTYSSAYSDIPQFSILIMQEKEILAEKIRAVLSRRKARDVYDMRFLLNNGVEIDESIITKKFEHYNHSWSIAEFEKSIESKRGIWDKELRPVLKNVPPFEEARKLILEEAKKWSFQKKPR